MPHRTGNYCAFYVSEPFNPTALGAHATKDFVYYNLLRTWKGKDSKFPFVDSHESTYSVRDDSDWEGTLKPRLRKRLSVSKNLVLFLTTATKNSKALREEINYGINTLGLPVIVIYPDYSTAGDLLSNGSLRTVITALWNNVPVFRDSMNMVPTVHVPLKHDLIKRALAHKDFMVGTKTTAKIYYFNSSA